MKRLVIMTCLVLLAIAGVQAQSQALKVWMDSHVTLTADSATVTYLKVYQSDGVEEYTSFNMSIIVPQGVKVRCAATGNDIALSQRGTASHVIACNIPADTLLKVACVSMQNENLSNRDAMGAAATELFSIGLIAEKQMVNGDYVVRMPAGGLVFNGKLGDTYVSSRIQEDATCRLTIEGGLDNSISATAKSSAHGVYDLQGRKIDRVDGQDGVYIEEGRKVLIND